MKMDLLLISKAILKNTKKLQFRKLPKSKIGPTTYVRPKILRLFGGR